MGMTRRDEFLQCLREHETRLRAYVGTLVRDIHSREDVFQNIVLALWKAWPRYDEERPFGAWARGVATRQVLTVTRDGQNVYAQLTGQARIQIHAKSATEFEWKIVEASVKFTKDKDGKVTKATHTQGGATFDAPKLK
jgi:DNA-directed RNA polymerase specialized sigma24 family protein